MKFADDTVVMGLVSNNDEPAYLGEVRRVTQRCQRDNLHLNVGKTKKLVVDFGRKQVRDYTLLIITYLGVQITNDLTWSTHLDK